MSWCQEEEAEYMVQMAAAEQKHAAAMAEAEYMHHIGLDIYESLAKAYILIEDLEYSPRELTKKELDLFEFLEKCVTTFVVANTEMFRDSQEINERYKQYLKNINK